MKIPISIALWLAIAVPPLFAAGTPNIHTSRENGRKLPLPKEKDVFHFLIYGDRTGGAEGGIDILREAVEDSNLLGPDFVMTVGDLVEGHNTREPWLKEMEEYRSVMSALKVPWFPVAGNHDIYWRGPGKPSGDHEANFEKHFGPLWYWFAYKNTGFIVLYSDEGNAETGEKGWHSPALNKFSEEQMAWLKTSLRETSGLDNVFIFVHHPKWRLKFYSGSNWIKIHRMLARAGNVRAVFAGHIHRMRYDGQRDGIEYFCLATTGGKISHDFAEGGWLHHMNLVTVRKDRYTVATLPVGSVIDTRKTDRPRLAELNKLLAMSPEHVSPPLKLQKDGSGSGEYTFSLRNPMARAIDISFEVDSESPRWVCTPDHGHAKIGPGEKKSFTIDLGREPSGFEDLVRPELLLQVDYLEEQRRLTYPDRLYPVPIALTDLPDGTFADRSSALRVNEKSALIVASDHLQLPDGPMTVEAWFRCEEIGSRQAIVAKAENSEFALLINEDVPTFIIHLGGRYRKLTGQAGDIKPGKWHHLAGVADGTAVRLYLDGKLVDRGGGRGARKRNDLPLLIGADPSNYGIPTSFFNGWIDEVHISSTARYQGRQVNPRRRQSPDEQSVLLLHMDQTYGPFFLDQSPCHAHAEKLGHAECLPHPK